LLENEPQCNIEIGKDQLLNIYFSHESCTAYALAKSTFPMKNPKHKFLKQKALRFYEFICKILVYVSPYHFF